MGGSSIMQYPSAMAKWTAVAARPTVCVPWCIDLEFWKAYTWCTIREV